MLDELGTLLDAIDAARSKAGIAPGEDVELRVFGEPSGLLAGDVNTPFVQATLPEHLRAFLKETGVPSTVLFEPSLKAQLPFQIRVE